MNLKELFRNTRQLAPVHKKMTLAQLCTPDKTEDYLAEGRAVDGYPVLIWDPNWLFRQPALWQRGQTYPKKREWKITTQS